MFYLLLAILIETQDRLLGKTLDNLESEDILIVSELSRLGRNLMEVMSSYMIFSSLQNFLIPFLIEGWFLAGD